MLIKKQMKSLKRVKRAEPTVPPDSQFLLGLRRLQDVDEVFQVVEVLGPCQPAAHCSHHLHRRRYHVLVLRCPSRERGVNTNTSTECVSACIVKLNVCVCSSHLEHLFIEQCSHGVRHDVVLERSRRHHHMAFGQLLGQLPQGATSTVDLKGRGTRKPWQTKAGRKEAEEREIMFPLLPGCASCARRSQTLGRCSR